MITTVDEFLAQGYRREVIDHTALTASDLAAMTRLLAKTDMKARLAALQDIPDQRCHISMIYRGLLTRALAQA